MEIVKKVKSILIKPYVRISLIYLLISIIWIVYSDKLLFNFFQDIESIQNFQLYKGLSFVFVTSGIIYFLIKRDYQLILKKNIQLEVSQSKLQLAFDASNLGMWQHDFKNEIIYFDELAKSYYDSKEYSVKLSELLTRIHPDDKERLLNEMNQTLKSNGKNKNKIVYRIINEKGKEKWLEVSSRINYEIKEETKIPVWGYGTVLDITQEKQDEQKLKSRNEFIETILDNLPIGLAVNFIDKGNVDYVNKKFIEIYGWPVDKIKDINSFFELVYPNPEYRKKIKNQIVLDIKSGDPEKMVWEGIEITRRNGDKRIVFAKNIPIFNQNLMISTVQDITEKFKAEAELEESKKRFEHAMNATKDGIFDWDLVTNKIYYSPGWKKMLGYEENELPNDFSIWEKLTKPEDVKKSWDEQQKLINKEIDRFVIEFKMKNKEGQWIDVLSRAEAIFDDQNNAVRIVGTHTDISESKRISEALKESEERLKLALVGADLGTWDWDFVSSKVVFNDRWAEMLGYKLSEIEPNIDSWKKLIYQQDFAKVQKQINEHLEGKTKSYEAEFRMLHKNGSLIWVLDKGKVIDRDNNGNPLRITGTHLDITNRKEAEESLQTTQKQLRALFTNLDKIKEQDSKLLARELHDELGQVLTSLRMNLSLLKNHLQNNTLDKKKLLIEFEEMSNIIDESKKNIKNLIRSLRPEYLDNLGLITALDHHIKEFNRNTDIKVNFKHNLSEIKLDQHIENIIYRTIQESLTNVAQHAEADKVDIELNLSANELIVLITDNGKGINPNDLKKINSFGILGIKERLQQYNSQLNIDSEIGNGTKLSFKIKIGINLD
jgi:PAS domain S-box-containing protein